MDGRTPVVAGSAAITQRVEDPRDGRDAVGLMIDASLAAAADAGAPSLLAAAHAVLVPKGSWSFTNPAAAIAGATGARHARTVLADIGVLQSTLIARAAGWVARGDADVVIVTGGEARWRFVRSRQVGLADQQSVQESGEGPDDVWQPESLVISQAEIGSGLITAASQYALIDNAWRAAHGETLAQQRARIDRVLADAGRVAAVNAHAWHREPLAAGRTIAFPYCKGDVSQWNVDQAAAIIVCSVDAARAHGVPIDRWVFPHAIAESNAIIPVTERADVHRSPAFAQCGQRAIELAQTNLDAINHIDLYSCFPIAVTIQQAELGIGPTAERPVTITGGMSIAGGPLNNAALQAVAQLVPRMRAGGSEDRGLVTAISGMITKQAVSIWSASPPAAGYRYDDVSVAASAATPARPVVEKATGRATVVAATVLHGRDGGPERAVAIVDVDGARAIAGSRDAAVMERIASEESAGRIVQLAGGEFAI